MNVILFFIEVVLFKYKEVIFNFVKRRKVKFDCRNVN